MTSGVSEVSRRLVMRKGGFGWAFFIFVLASAIPAQAKVVFTGYGDFRYTALSAFDIEGPASLLATFNLRDTSIKSRSARMESVGIFATTNLSPGLDFLMDVTYREIGVKTNELRLQYAYLNYAVSEQTELSLGKITLPFGYLNQQKFYSFQRVAITAPTFQQGILGLPIADIGASASHQLPVGPVQLKADIYAVNGYGPITGSTASFRNGSLPGGLVLANNLPSRDANNRTAFGGRFTFSPAGNPEIEAGVSYYSGHWNSEGTSPFEMKNAHLHADVSHFEFLAEYLCLDIEGDQGFVNNLGIADWRTTGYFGKLSYDGFQIAGKPLIPWVRFEEYASHGVGGGSGREKLRSPAGGVALKTTENVSIKLEVSHLFYVIPFQGQGDLKLEGNSYLLGASFTF
jgi:hypothetical protein